MLYEVVILLFAANLHRHLYRWHHTEICVSLNEDIRNFVLKINLLYVVVTSVVILCFESRFCGIRLC